MSRASGGAHVAAALIGGVLFGYVALRAHRLAFTHDEAFTFTYWIATPIRNTLTFDGPERANNHLLSTLLAKVSGHFLGKRELPLRLPNVLAYGVYLLLLWRLLSRRAPAAIALSGFVLGAANPLLLELFGLCRGYGLSLAFLAGALLLADRALEEPSGGREAAALLVLGAGALAQLVLVDAFAALALVLLASAGAHAWRERRLARLLPTAAACLVTAAFVVPILRLLGEAKQFYGGGKEGFFEDTVKTTVFYSFMRAPYGGWARPWAVRLVVAGAALCGAVAMGLLARRRKTSEERAALGLIVLPFLAAAIAMLQTALLGTASLRDRSALLFVPLGAVAVTLSLTELARKGSLVEVSTKGVASAVALLSLVHLGRVANTRESFLWWFDADDRRMVDDLTRLHFDRPIRLGVTWFFEPSVNFYRATRNLDWLQKVTRDGPFGAYDYSYFLDADVPEALSKGWVPVATYEQTKSMLARAPSR